LRESLYNGLAGKEVNLQVRFVTVIVPSVFVASLKILYPC
jgi:hypothetical protein